MAITKTTVLAGSDEMIVDLTANDSTTTATIAHGLGAAPLEVTTTPLLTPEAYTNQWAVTTIDATNVVVTRTADEAGESPNPQLRVIIRRPHSIFR